MYVVKLVCVVKSCSTVEMKAKRSDFDSKVEIVLISTLNHEYS